MGASPREKASAEAASTAADRSAALAGITFPELRNVLSQINSDFTTDANGGIGIPKSVQKAYGTASAGIDQDYATAGRGQQAFTAQQFRQSGNPYSTAQIGDAMAVNAQQLEQSRRQAQNNLKFQESAAGLGQFNNLMNMMGVGAGAALNLGGGFASQQAQAIGGLSQQSQGQGALAGGLSGAATGATVGGPWGALIGGVLGAGAGYFGANS